MTPYYSDDSVTIYNGDCREILPTLDPVDLVLTDPPFEKEAHTLQRRVSGSTGRTEIKLLPFDAITEEIRKESSALIAALANRWVLTFCQIEAAPNWRATYEAAGLVYKRTCLWIKPDGMPQYSGDRPGMGYETFVAMHKPGRSKWNGGGRHGVFVYNTSEGGGGNEHPTVKPLKLIKDLVSLFSNPGEAVLDPFMGSGTTLRAAKDLGRKAIGIELNERYCELAARRMGQEVLAL
jgi:site-specific DNA-methyltransferase (adenine-specific)